METIFSSSEKDLLFRIKTLMFLRVITITIFLGSVIFFRHIIGGTLHLESISSLIIVTYLLTLLYAMVLSRVKNLPLFCYVQIVGDIFVETAIISITGGIESPLSFLYPLSIISAGIIHYRSGIYLIASIASICFGAIIIFEYYNWLYPIYIYPKSNIASEGSYVLYITFVTICSFYLIAFLTGFLVEKLRLTGKELSEKDDHLQELRAFHENVVKSMGSGLLTIDLEGRITSFNNAAEEITGLTFAGLRGKPFFEIFHFSEPDMIQQLQKGNFPYNYEDVSLKNISKKLSLEMIISVLKDEEGTVKGYISVFQDKTEFREMEERVIQAEKFAAVGKVAAGIAHEIRNPLASMSGSVQVLKQNPLMEKDSKDLMDIVVKETERLNSIITRFLNYARPHPVNLANIDINSIISDTILMLKNSAEYNQNIKISTKFEDETLFIKIDSQQVQQVLWNLCLNSVQAMENGGELKIWTGLGGKENKKYAVIEISDTGCGIEEKDKDSIFDPFHTTKPSGTGLGLATVYKIIENHKGTIRVNSKVSEGSTVTVNIPIT